MDATLALESFSTAASTAARTRALAAATRAAIGRSRERIEDTSRLIRKSHNLPNFQLATHELPPEQRAEAIQVSVELSQQREIDRETNATRTLS